jgi:hypothetical protein
VTTVVTVVTIGGGGDGSGDSAASADSGDIGNRGTGNLFDDIALRRTTRESADECVRMCEASQTFIVETKSRRDRQS